KSHVRRKPTIDGRNQALITLKDPRTREMQRCESAKFKQRVKAPGCLTKVIVNSRVPRACLATTMRSMSHWTVPVKIHHKSPNQLSRFEHITSETTIDFINRLNSIFRSKNATALIWTCQCIFAYSRRAQSPVVVRYVLTNGCRWTKRLEGHPRTLRTAQQIDFFRTALSIE
ncbi:hypothetical protein GCK32_021830, partial [Trichostrongylus colubriformis]